MPKPKDFTESAENLCNPEPVKALLEKLSKAQASQNKIQEEIRASNTVLVEKLEKHTKVVSDLQVKIREAVEKYGSYQDTEAERYAVKYARKTEGYNLEPFKSQFSKFVGLCVKETLDVQALRGQIKGKLITIKELEDTGVLDYTTTYAFYVR